VPSPKSHRHTRISAGGVTLDNHLKLTALLPHTESNAKLATGDGSTVTGLVIESIQPLELVVINLTLYIPAV
jgi:hypothetical protein